MKLNKFKILVVEDNPSDRVLLADLLKKMNEHFEVRSVGSYIDAKAAFEGDAPDLVLLDIYLPDKTGFSFLQEIHKNTFRDIPVILVSSTSDKEDKLKGFEMGAIDFINKPIVAEDMKARVAVQLRLKKIKDDYEWAFQKTNEGIKLLYKELENKNAQLEKLNQIKDDFVNIVSHELRTPLTVIRESISQIVDGLLGDINEKQNKYLNTSLTNIDYLIRIINDLLDISKIEKGKIEIYKEKVDIIDLIEEVVFNFLPQTEKKGLQIKFDVPDQKMYILADKQRIIQVMNNLVANAYKFTQKGYIEISVIDEGSSVKCTVRDTGIGVAPKDLPRLFSKFDQIGRQSGPGMKGTGLGLVIAKEIIERHDGKIHVESVLQEGTKFIFTLPKYNILEEDYLNLIVCLGEQIKKYNSFALIGYKIFGLGQQPQESLTHLTSQIKNHLLGVSDQIVLGKNGVYIILPDTKKEHVNLTAQMICQIIEEKSQGVSLKTLKDLNFHIVNYPQDGRTADELVVKLETNK
ncbi:MAG: hybrid sensor histidine kinase/response regulator [Candidatus Omnitrophica bacterium]|nr:hybrid sensor histidine kinase/response regulator [Candidatus Omnitrophota bacterium]